MSYAVDVVTEDSFYENLILGLTKVLENTLRISNVIIERKLPVDRLTLSSWEQRNSVTLPEDIRQFYLSTDGFKLKWSYQYSYDEVLSVGLININELNELTTTTKLREILDLAMSKSIPPHDKYPTIGPKTKLFELDDCKGRGKVCLVHSENTWSIWLLDFQGVWTWLADSFIYYFRMALVHHGLPGWQAVFSKTGLLPWTEQLFLLIAPHLLPDNDDFNRSSGGSLDAPLNHIDPGIFKNSSKHSNKSTGGK